MIYPTVNAKNNSSRDMIDIFGGYNHNLRIKDNEFYDMKNMSSSLYPVLSPRAKRGVAPIRSSNVQGMIYKSVFYYVTVTNNYLHIYAYDTLTGTSCSKGLEKTQYDSEVKRQIVPMGAYLIILPDKQYVNTMSIINDTDDNWNDYGYIEQNFTSEEKVTLQACRSNGEVYSINYVGDTEPVNVADDYVWLDTSVSPASLKYYIASNSSWYGFTSTLVKIGAKGIGTCFKEGDGIKISGVVNINIQDLNATTVIKSIPDNDSIIVTGLISTMESNFVLEAVDSRTVEDGGNLPAYCDSDFEENALAGKYIHIGNQVAYAIANTAPKQKIGYRNSSIGFTEDCLYLEVATGTKMNVLTQEITVTQNNDALYEAIAPNTYILINGKLNRIEGKSYDSHGNIIIKITEPIVYKGDEILIFVAEDYLTDKYFTNITLNTGITVKEGDKICPTIESQYMQDEAITLSRTMPEMDFVIESKNRLWGCRYGTNANGETVNEIYASKLGDFKNWNCFEGVSTDSYVASLGTDGVFTGAISYQGYPLFFKENYMHMVYGNYPAQYQINDTACRGVQKGSENSLALINEVLYYKSRAGVMAYSGSLPNCVSHALGNKMYTDAIACAYKNKYYISMINVETAKRKLFVLDTQYSLWHKEDKLNIAQMCSVDNDIYYIEDGTLYSLFGTGGVKEKNVEWYIETGEMGLSYADKKYITRISVRLSMELGAKVSIYIQYDSNGIWEHKVTLMGEKLKTITQSIRPKRCDHFKLRIEGVGDVKIYSISKTLEQGSDI